jgi:NADP-dependent 3-hydroxy acid dehydrogenase YdfG
LRDVSTTEDMTPPDRPTGGIAGLEGCRVVVIGASAGLGRAVAAQAICSGADVLLVARREERLRETVSATGGGAWLQADITDHEKCLEIAGAAASMGQIDLVINTTGVSRLMQMASTTTAEWEYVIRTNVIGVNQLIAALIPVMAPEGIITVVSSEAVHQPRAGLGAYGASKAALESSLCAWRIEHAPLRFCCVAIGATLPTEVAAGYDPVLTETMLESWLRHGLIQAGFMTTDEVAKTLLHVLAAVHAAPSVCADYLLLRSPAPVIASISGRSSP